MATAFRENTLRRTKLVLALREYGIYFALALLVATFCIISPRFARLDNFVLILLQVSVTGIISVGMLFVLLSGGIDLSVGSTLAVAGMMSGVYAHMNPTPMNIVIALAAPLTIGILCGVINGSLVAWARIPALIVTLGTLYAYRGFVIWYRVNPIYDLEPWYRVIGQGSLGPIPLPVVIFFLVCILSSIILNLTRFGRYIYSVGGNEQAARAAGINISLVKLGVFTISGLLCGLAGLVFTSRLGAAQAISGQGYELIAIASVVVGGASMFGGRGTVSKTIVGALIIQVLQNGLVMLNVPSPIQQMIIGGIIILAVGLDNLIRKN